jgi:prophage antirepressor-like protein
MKSVIQIFRNTQFGEVRVTEIDGEPMFVAVDVCQILGYSNTSKAINDHTEPDERYNESLERGGNMLFINESGLYSLIIRSNKEEAKPFRKWVTSEVLPAIRKHGGYLTAQNIKSNIAA